MMHDSPLPRLNFWVFWKNSRNRLAGIHSRQAMHVDYVVLSSREESPGCEAPGDISLSPTFGFS